MNEKINKNESKDILMHYQITEHRIKIQNQINSNH